MKRLFVAIIFIGLNSTYVSAQNNLAVIRDVGDRCLAAFQREPSSSKLIPPRAFCLCVAQQVSTSLDDKKIATDRAGIFCLKLMSSLNSYGDGIARGQRESCMKDKEVLLYYPSRYRDFCSCLGDKLSEEITSNKPLLRSESLSLAAEINESREKAAESCIKIVPRQ